MNKKRVQEIKANLISKDTDELLELWKTNNRDNYTDEAFEAIKLILVDRNVPVTEQLYYIPEEERPERYQWNLSSVKLLRTIYLVIFFLLIPCNIGVVFAPPLYFSQILLGILFLPIFMSTARKTVHYTIGSIIGMSFVILFIPLFSILTIALVDRRIYDAIKMKVKMRYVDT